MTQSRVQRGVPSGGQFAASQLAESDLVLDGEPAQPNPGDVHDGVRRLNDAYTAWQSSERAAADARVAADRSAAEFRATLEELRGIAPGVASEADRGLALEAAAPQQGSYPGDWATLSCDDPAFDDPLYVPDAVEGTDGTVYHRRREGVYPREPYAMRFQANRALSEADIDHAASLVGYAYRAEVRGEPIGGIERDTPNSFIVRADTTKSSSDDIGQALQRFEEKLPQMLAEGSPVRSSDRAGYGTRGTRLIEGFNEPDLGFEIYYDDVSRDEQAENPGELPRHAPGGFNPNWHPPQG